MNRSSRQLFVILKVAYLLTLHDVKSEGFFIMFLQSKSKVKTMNDQPYQCKLLIAGHSLVL